MSFKDPKTKEDVVNRLLAQDFSGDIRDLAKDRQMRLTRTGLNKLEMHFLESNQKFTLTVSRPLPEGSTRRGLMRERMQGLMADAKAGREVGTLAPEDRLVMDLPAEAVGRATPEVRVGNGAPPGVAKSRGRNAVRGTGSG